MRIVWIAGAVMVLVLALAVGMRPASHSREDKTLATLNEAGLAEVPQVVERQPLGTDDWARIIELRAQIGSAMDRVSGQHVAQAAFERELRQVAGLAAPPASETVSLSDQIGSIPDAHRAPQSSDRSHRLRDAAATLDELASEAEEARDYCRADQLRHLSDGVRRARRELVNEAGSVGDRLIDNAPAPQSK